MKIVFATSLDNNHVWLATNFLEKLVENKDIIYLRQPIGKGIAEKYDIGISFLYQHKIPESELSVPWINFHPGPLPDYRGRNVIYHAIMNREEEFGGTIHYMDKNFDTGPIIEVEKFEILETDTAGDVLDKTYDSLLNLFYKYLPQVLEGRKLKTYRQDSWQANYYKQSKINEYIKVDDYTFREIRALTVHPKYHAKIKISNKTYKIVPQE